jgi:hypothetical protein
MLKPRKAVRDTKLYVVCNVDETGKCICVKNKCLF